MHSLHSDVHYALRTFRKRPGFAVVAVLTLALGIGANSALFTVVNSVLLRPLPFPHSGRLFAVGVAPPPSGFGDVPGSMLDSDYLEYAREAQAFESVAAYAGRGLTLTGGGDPVHVRATEATAHFFQALGVRAAIGRTFLPGDTGGVVVLSDQFWRTRFRGDRDVAGKTVTLDGQAFTVVGVMPPGFVFPTAPDLWTPFAVRVQKGNSFFLPVIGRLRAGYDSRQARAELENFARIVHPGSYAHWTARVLPLRDFMVRDVRLSLLVLLGAVGFVLLIACANVATLLLARSSQRNQEIALRHSLGATRGRLVRQLVTESLMLSVAGGALGIVLALWGVEGLMAAMPGGRVPRVEEIGVDAWVLAFNFAVSLVAGLAAGLVPAAQLTRSPLYSSLREQRGSRGNQRLRGFLAVAEIAVTLVLLIGAGLMVRSFLRLRSVKTGFDPSGVLTATVELSPAYNSTSRMIAFHRELLARLSALPGVSAVGAVNWLPLAEGASIRGDFQVEGQSRAPTFEPYKPAVSTDYFRAMGIPLLQGRFFDQRDARSAPGVAIVSQSVARLVWPGGNPLGKRITLEDAPKPEDWLTVVGVVDDVKQLAMTQTSPPAIYQPYAQVTRPFFLAGMNYVVRSAGDPAALAGAIRRQVQALDPNQPVLRLATMRNLIATLTAEPRFQAGLIGAFAAMALLLAVIGIHGVMSYFVAERIHEIGIRMALGAGAADVLRMVVRQGMLLVAVGIFFGALGAWGATRVLATLLFELRPADPPTYVGVALLLAAVALAAILIPAYRAARVDPNVALRYE